ncbi:MAG TPA: phosphate/phosphite/phosphonate ABC transporter substrate-binding protein [bacterium]|nr:phosphate/phosphite/phosphonate ABC transporter substrate-binding protein [bacterium]
MFNKNFPRNLIVILAAILFIGLTCASYLGLTYRHIDAAVDLSSPPLPVTAQSLHEGPSFRVAVANMLSPMKGYQHYEDLADLLAHEFGLPLELVTAESYSEVNTMLRESKVDLAFVCVGGFASARSDMDVIASPVIDGQARFNSLIIVPADGPAQALIDLKGKRFLYVDPESATGYWYMAQRIRELGHSPETFFAQVSWTGSHDHSITAVAQHIADGACVSSIIYRLMTHNDPSLARRIRIIETSPPYPSPPVVVRTSMPVSQRNRLANTLVNLADSRDGRAILKDLGIDGFVPARNSDYLAVEPLEASP